MWTYNDLDELYHHGILGMKWGYRKNQTKNQTKNVKKDNKKKQWSMKKKILVGASITAGIIGGVIGAKKLKNYINRQNHNVAEHFASKIMVKNGWNKTSLKKASEVRKMIDNQPMKYKIRNVLKYKFNPRYPYK